MPDLTCDECWVNKIFEEIDMKKSLLQCKAEVWMTYRHKVKELFGLHRAGVTIKIKKEFIQGETKMMKLMTKIKPLGNQKIVLFHN